MLIQRIHLAHARWNHREGKRYRHQKENSTLDDLFEIFVDDILHVIVSRETKLFETLVFRIDIIS